MSATSILCRCGQKLRLPDQRTVIAKCPSCGRKVDYFDDEDAVGKLDRKAYRRLLRAGKEEVESIPAESESVAFFSALGTAVGQFLLANLFWVFSGVCIAAMVGACVFFFAQTFEPSEAQLSYEMAVEMRKEGRHDDARTLLLQVVDQNPRSRWARHAQSMLAEMPGVSSGPR